MTCQRHPPDPGRDTALAVLAERYRTGCPETVVRDHTPPRICLHCGGSEDFGAYAQCQPNGAELIGGCWSGCGGTTWRHHVTWAALDAFVAAPQMAMDL